MKEQRLLEQIAADFRQDCVAGRSPSVDRARERMQEVFDTYEAALARITNVLLLSGVAGTMVALFGVSARLSAAKVMTKALLLGTYQHAFSAFSVAIVGVSLAAMVYVLGHFVRQRFDETIELLTRELVALRSAFDAPADRPERQLAREIHTAIEGLERTLSSSSAQTAQALTDMSEELGDSLAPLSEFEELFEGVSSSVQQLSQFVKGHGDMLAMMGELRDASEALRSTAASLPQEYREHTTTTANELHRFGDDSAKAMGAITASVGELAAYVSDLPQRTRTLLDGGLKAYETNAREAFEGYTSSLRRLGEESEAGVRTVMRASAEEAKTLLEAPVSRLQHSLDDHAEHLDGVAARISGRIQEIGTAFGHLENSAGRAATGLRRVSGGLDFPDRRPPIDRGAATESGSVGSRRRTWVALAAACACAIALAGGVVYNLPSEHGAEPAQESAEAPSATVLAPANTYTLATTVPGEFALYGASDGSKLVAQAGQSVGEGLATLLAVGDGCVVQHSAGGDIETVCRPLQDQHADPTRVSAELDALPAAVALQLIRVRYGDLGRPERLAILRTLRAQYRACERQSSAVDREVATLWFDADPVVARLALDRFLLGPEARSDGRCESYSGAADLVLRLISHGDDALLPTALSVAAARYCSAIDWHEASRLGRGGPAMLERLLALAKACRRPTLERQLGYQKCIASGVSQSTCRKRYPLPTARKARQTTRTQRTGQLATAAAQDKRSGSLSVD